MARPGFVLEVDEKTPPLLRLAGARVGAHRFANGTRVLYPPDAEPSTSPVELVDRALDAPLAAEPLVARLSPKQKLTIVVTSDVSLRPPMRFDVRRTIVERVLELAARVGVHDVQIVMASGLRRSWNANKLILTLGDRVFSSFAPDHLIHHHDVTAPDLVEVGSVDGHPVKLNKRIAESDLVVLAGVRLGATSPCMLASNATDVATINRISGYQADPGFADRVSEIIREAVPTFAVIGVAGQPYFGNGLSFLNRREWEWKLPEQLSFTAVRQTLELLPKRAGDRLFGSLMADYAVLDVVGGDLQQAQAEATRSWIAASAVPVKQQHDVVICSAFGVMFEDHDPVGNPLSASHHVLVDQVASALGEHHLMAKPGGVVVAWHPLTARFPHRIQAAAADFFTSVLPETTDPATIHATYEERAMHDEWYVRLYRDYQADHPLQVYHQWYRTASVSQQVSDVIWVGADRASAATLGHRAASTLADAMEIASDVVGKGPSTLYLHAPGTAVGRLG